MIYRLVKRDRLRAIAKSLVSGIPCFTEKTSLKRAQNTVAFIVDKRTTKLDIQESFKRENDGVKVEVNTLVRKGKVKRVKGVKGKRKDIKIAFVRFPQDFKLPNVYGEAEV